MIGNYYTGPTATLATTTFTSFPYEFTLPRDDNAREEILDWVRQSCKGYFITVDQTMIHIPKLKLSNEKEYVALLLKFAK